MTLEVIPAEAEKAFKFPILGGILRAAISLIGFYHILNGDSVGLAIQMRGLSKEKNTPKYIPPAK